MDATRELETEDARRKNESVELLKFLRQTEHAGDAIRCPICNTSGKFRTTLVMYVPPCSAQRNPQPPVTKDRPANKTTLPTNHALSGHVDSTFDH
jgi:hypothetical protein